MENPSYKRIEEIRKKPPIKPQEIIQLLSEKGKKLRQDDGNLMQINTSVSVTQKGAFVIGLRYIKRDGSQTEDHFCCKENIRAGEEEIKYYNKNKLEKELPEYKGAHKQQVENIQDIGSYTSVNTMNNFYHGK